ncbi:heavy metal translocating P-type ATPase, partial [Pseudotenacibaculum sp. MALMAid0570]
GEKIPLDGVLLSEKASLNTAALTGESKPDSILKEDKVYAGSINLESVIEVEVTNTFEDSSIARILDLVQNATARKSKTELF